MRTAVSPPTANVTGTTGTGLDFLVSSIAADPGLNERIARSQIAEGATAADGMNHMIVDAIRATGTGLDSIVDIMGQVAGLHTKIPAS